MQSSNQQWHFFYYDNTGICYKKKSAHRWSDYEILFKEGLGDFDVLVDAEDNIHLVCQDKLGSIIYLLYNDQQWHKYTILQSKSNHVYPKYFKIFSINNWINLLYIIRHKEKNLLVHQILDNNAAPPNVLDYVVSSAYPFSASMDDENNIHVYYQRNDKQANLGYQNYIWSKKSWGDFTALDIENADILAPYSIIDEEGNTHLIYLNKT